MVSRWETRAHIGPILIRRPVIPKMVFTVFRYDRGRDRQLGCYGSRPSLVWFGRLNSRSVFLELSRRRNINITVRFSFCCKAFEFVFRHVDA